MPKAHALFPQGLHFNWFSQLDSTNGEALSGCWPEATVIASDCQKAGRGRLGRTWLSPPGQNLYFSLVLYPRLSRAHWGGLSLAAGVGAARCLDQLGVAVNLKWPNDLLWQGRKLAGILLEARDDKLVVGMGLNVNQTRFPAQLPATSLSLATGKSWRRDYLLALLAGEIFRFCSLWGQGQQQEIITYWKEYDIILGQEISVLRGRETLRGKAVNLSPGGGLILESQGVRHLLNSGEVSIGKCME